MRFFNIADNWDHKDDVLSMVAHREYIQGRLLFDRETLSYFNDYSLIIMNTNYYLSSLRSLFKLHISSVFMRNGVVFSRSCLEP